MRRNGWSAVKGVCLPSQAEQADAADSRYNRAVWRVQGREPLIGGVRGFP
jgi:hypothetical protein